MNSRTALLTRRRGTSPLLLLVGGLSTGLALAAAASILLALLATSCGTAPGWILRDEQGVRVGEARGCPEAVDEAGPEVSAFARDLAAALDLDATDVLDYVGGVKILCAPRHDQRALCANAFRHGGDPDPEACLVPDGDGARIAPSILPGAYVAADAAAPVGLVLHEVTHLVLRDLLGDVDAEHEREDVRRVLPAWGAP